MESIMNTLIATHLFQFFLIGHHDNFHDANIVKNYLIKEKFIPENEIVLERISTPCHKRAVIEKLIAQFCVDKNGDLTVLKLDQKTYERIYLNY